MGSEQRGEMADLRTTVGQCWVSVACARRLQRRGGRASSDRASRLQAVFGPMRGQRACGEERRAGSGQRAAQRIKAAGIPEGVRVVWTTVAGCEGWRLRSPAVEISSIPMVAGPETRNALSGPVILDTDWENPR